MPEIFSDILILSGVATLTILVTHYFRLPTIVGFVLTGVLIGPNSFKLVSSLPDAHSLTELASIILMFTIGLEFSFSKLKDLRHQLLKLGTAQVFITIAVVSGAAHLLAYGPSKSLLWGFMISLSSTALVLKLLHDFRDLNAPHGRNSIGILLFQDLIVIPMLLVIPFLAPETSNSFGASGMETVVWTGKVVAIGFMLYLTKKFLLSIVLERVVATKSHELFSISIIFVCLGAGYLFHLVGLSLSIGAFVAGAIVSESAFGHQATSIFGTLRDTFLGLFFVTIGMLLDFGFIVTNFTNIALLGVGFFLLKSGIVFFVCLAFRTSTSVAILTALSVSQVGEFSFLIASEAVEHNVLSATDNQYFLAISVLSMIFTPFLYLLGPRVVKSRPFVNWKALRFLPESLAIKNELKPERLFGQKIGEQRPPETIVIGYGIAGQNVVSALQDLEIPYQVIESNYEIVKKSQARGVNICFGDATHREILSNAGIDHAKIVVIAVSDTHATPGIIAAIRAHRPDVPVVVRVQYARDLSGLKADPLTTLVIAEIETATELVAHVLKGYGLPAKLIFEYALQAKQQLTAHGKIGAGHRYNLLSLPSWDALTSIRPFQVEKDHFAAGKSLADVSLPEHTGGSVVSVFRAGVGTKVPNGRFTIQAGDVLHIISSPETTTDVINLLRNGKPTTANASSSVETI